MEPGDQLALEELRVERRVPLEARDPLAKARGLGRLQVLRLVADRDPRRRGPGRGRLDTRQHPDEGGLPGRVRADDPDRLALREHAGADLELERVELLRQRPERHGHVLTGRGLRGMSDETDRLGPEPDVLVPQVAGQVGVHRRAHREGVRDDAERRLLAVHEVRLVGEVVQSARSCSTTTTLFALAQPTEDAGDLEAVDDVEVARRFIEQVQVGVGRQRAGDRDELELSARELREEPVRLCARAGPILERRVRRSPPPAARTRARCPGRSASRSTYCGFTTDRSSPARDLLEVGRERGAAVVLDDRLPGRLRVVVAQVRDLLAGEDPERRGLPGPVRAEDARDPLRIGEREPVEAEPVVPVPVNDLRLFGLGAC